MGAVSGHFAAADKPKFFTSRRVLTVLAIYACGRDLVTACFGCGRDCSVNPGSDLDLDWDLKPFTCNILAPVSISGSFPITERFIPLSINYHDFHYTYTSVLN